MLTLRHVIKNYTDLTEYSEFLDNSGVTWVLVVEKNNSDFEVKIICHPGAQKDENWWIKANLELRFSTAYGIAKQNVFNANMPVYVFKYQFEEVAKLHEDNKEVILECHVEICHVSGIVPQWKKRAEPPNVNTCSDLTLIAGEEKFEVSRMMLAANSPIFKELFFASAESKATNEFILDSDVNPKDFENLLGIFNRTTTLTEDNISGIWKLAKKYEILAVKTECEMFLKWNTELDKKKKFKLVDEFGFEELKMEMLDSFTSTQDLRDCLPANFADLDASTKAAIAEKLVDRSL